MKKSSITCLLGKVFASISSTKRYLIPSGLLHVAGDVRDDVSDDVSSSAWQLISVIAWPVTETPSLLNHSYLQLSLFFPSFSHFYRSIISLSLYIYIYIYIYNILCVCVCVCVCVVISVFQYSYLSLSFLTCLSLFLSINLSI